MIEPTGTARTAACPVAMVAAAVRFASRDSAAGDQRPAPCLNPSDLPVLEQAFAAVQGRLDRGYTEAVDAAEAHGERAETRHCSLPVDVSEAPWEPEVPEPSGLQFAEEDVEPRPIRTG